MADNSEAAPSVAPKAEEESTNPQAQEPSTIPPIIRAYSNKLTPPAEASFWRHQTISLLQDYKLEYLPDEPGIDVFETLTWRIDAFVYVVNAVPDANFVSNGGSVYVILVHSGAAMCNDNTEGMEHRYHVWLENPSSRAYPLMQLPASNTGTNDPNLGTIKYPISFTQDMQMFKNGGNETFTFSAQYESSIDVKDGIQTGVVDGSSGVKWSIRIDKTPDTDFPFPFGSLSVFQFSELEEVAFNVKITEHNASFYTDPIGESDIFHFKVDCRFSV